MKLELSYQDFRCYQYKSIFHKKIVSKNVKGMTSEMYNRDNNITRLIIAKLIVLQISQYILVLFVELYEFLNFCA